MSHCRAYFSLNLRASLQLTVYIMEASLSSGSFGSKLVAAWQNLMELWIETHWCLPITTGRYARGFATRVELVTDIDDGPRGNDHHSRETYVEFAVPLRAVLARKGCDDPQVRTL